MKQSNSPAAGPTPCNDSAFLQRYLREELDETEEQRVQAHVSSCPKCQSALESAAGDPSLWSEVRNGLGAECDEAEVGNEAQLERVAEFLAPTDHPEMIGRLGHYEVRGIIGSGSTGIVLKGFEPRLDRFVAIKLMSPSFGTSGAARRRFEREGRAVAAVAHEHVVPIYSVDDYRGLPYIVMKFVPGPSLQQRIERDGPLDSCAVARVGLQVASALAAAHAQGIVHRDVKPANVILEENIDRAMVTDFGLARVADEASMTKSGTITGTPQYMSPEQARGDSVDLRSDLFSLGSLLYAASTGHAPFRAQTLYGVIHRVSSTEARPVRESNPETDEWRAAIIDKLMEKHVDDRFQSANEVADALESELARMQNPTGSPVPKRDWSTAPDATPAAPSRRRAIALVLTAAAVLIAGFALMFERGDATDNPGANGDANHAAILARGSAADSFSQQDPTNTPLPGARVQWTTDSEVVNGTSVLQQTIEHVLTADPGGRVQLLIDAGDIVLIPTDERVFWLQIIRKIAATDRASAERVAHGHQLRAVSEPNGVRFEAKFAGEGASEAMRSISFNFAVPRESAVELDAKQGHVEIRDLRGDLKTSIEDGDLQLSNVSGTIDATTHRGDIEVAGCVTAELLAIHGDINIGGVKTDATALTSNGQITLTGSTGRVYAQTSGGGIRVERIDGPTGGFASGGDVEVRVQHTPAANSRFRASDGNVIAEVGSDVNAELALRGAFDSPFPVDVVAAEQDGEEDWSVSQLNGGGPRIRLASSTGRVTVRSVDPVDDAPAPADPSSELVGSGADSADSGSGVGGSGSDGGSGSGGSGSGGSGYGGSGSGGSGPGNPEDAPPLSETARARTAGPPRAGALATVKLPPNDSAMDGYTLYLPASHGQTDERTPILVFLQGAYGVGGEIENVNNWGLARLLRDETDMSNERNRMLLDQFIVVCPHIQRGGYDNAPSVVRGILDEILEKWNGDPERIYMTGLSRGGHGSWGLAEKLPTTFAAIAPIGGNANGVRDWPALAGTAIWVSHNSGDGLVPFAAAEDAMREVEQHFDVKFRRFNTLNVRGTDYLDHRYILTSARTDSHNAWTDVYSSAEFYQWLLQQRRKQPAKPDERIR